MTVVCKYNDPTEVPYGTPDNFDYGLVIGKHYLVMGICSFQPSEWTTYGTLYYLVDDGDDCPSWFPYQIFDLIDNRIPATWYVSNAGATTEANYQHLIGYDELCNDNKYFNALLERESEALIIYTKHKEAMNRDL